MLIKQSIINDAHINSVFSIRFATRRPITNGFRVEPNEVRFVSRKPSIGFPETIRNSSTGQKSIFSIRFFIRRPITNGFRVKPNEVRFVSRKPSIGFPETIRNSSTGQKSIFSIRFFIRRPTY